MESWYVVEERELRKLLQKATDGADPDELLIEFYANCEQREHIDGDDDGRTI